MRRRPPDGRPFYLPRPPLSPRALRPVSTFPVLLCGPLSPVMTLLSLGWDDSFANAFPSLSDSELMPARVALEHKHAYALLSASGDLIAECTGKLLHAAVS